jgi:hypothetical protein
MDGERGRRRVFFRYRHAHQQHSLWILARAPGGRATGATATRAPSTPAIRPPGARRGRSWAGRRRRGRPAAGWCPRRSVPPRPPAVESRPPSTGLPGRRRPCARSSQVGSGAPRDGPVSRKGTADRNQEHRRGLVPRRVKPLFSGHPAPPLTMRVPGAGIPHGPCKTSGFRSQRHLPGSVDPI